MHYARALLIALMNGRESSAVLYSQKALKDPFYHDRYSKSLIFDNRPLQVSGDYSYKCM